MSLFSSRQKGQTYEARAEAYLQQHGLIPVQRNFQVRGGEIDLIMREQAKWVFIEVKYRQSETYGSGLDAIDWRKIQRIKRTALYWLHKNKINSEMVPIRFDVVYITNHQIEWLKNIVQDR
ncbi:YraN family protein [Thaumasiovibrio sp. DFM-14]|uniref:YraN family protein n=1 Tax=Thaumasiovibrio sp. DFM-14 TaxID=3384792 RepID=UPI0039A24633